MTQPLPHAIRPPKAPKFNKKFIWNLVITILIWLALVVLLVTRETILVERILQEAGKETYGSIATVASALLGFIIAGISILSITLNKQQMKKTGLDRFNEQIYEYFYMSSVCLGLLTTTSIIGLAMPKEEVYSSIILYTVLLFFFLSALLLYKSINILKLIIIFDSNESDQLAPQEPEPKLDPKNNGDIYKAQHLN